jgi:hypothetical protein
MFNVRGLNGQVISLSRDLMDGFEVWPHCTRPDIQTDVRDAHLHSSGPVEALETDGAVGDVRGTT